MKKDNLKSALAFLGGIGFTGTHCIFTSLAVRDFLRMINIKADVKSVALMVSASHEGLPMHKLGIGMNKLWNEPYTGNRWDGHMIVTVPGYIIDPTFHTVRRNSWDWTPPIAIAKRGSQPQYPVSEAPALPIIATAQFESPEDQYVFQAVWFAYSRNNGWRDTPDGRDHTRRQELIRDLLDAWRQHETLRRD